jgi:hypothetical protein
VGESRVITAALEHLGELRVVPGGHQVIRIRRDFAGLLTETFFHSLAPNDYQVDMWSLSDIIHYRSM